MSYKNFSYLILTKEILQNMSSNLSISECKDVMLTDYQHDLIPVIYTIIFFFGFIGNSLIITVLCFQGGTKTIANIYILNLAIADLLSLSTLPFWATYYALGFNWLFGKVMCKISSSLLCLNLFASIFLISCMSVDRYVAIVYPLRSQRRTSHQAFIVVFMVWGLAIMSTLPTFYFRNMYYIGNLGVNACVMDFPEEEYTNWFVAISYMKISFGFCFPLAVIGTCYLMIASHLKKPKGLLLNNQNRDRVLKIVTAIVLAFIVCWLPFHLLTFLDTLLRMEILTNCKLVTVLDTAMPFSICMGFFNSCINPFLYCFVGNQFRENFRHLFTSHHDNSRQNSSRKGSDSAWANDNVKV